MHLLSRRLKNQRLYEKNFFHIVDVCHKNTTGPITVYALEAIIIGVRPIFDKDDG